MAYQYTSTTREHDTHALPDCEVFHACTGELWTDRDCDEFGDRRESDSEPGWYFAFLDGGIDCWTGDPSGPYASEAEALAEAREAAGLCPHGAQDDEPCVDCDPN